MGSASYGDERLTLAGESYPALAIYTGSNGDTSHIFLSATGKVDGVITNGVVFTLDNYTASTVDLTIYDQNGDETTHPSLPFSQGAIAALRANKQNVLGQTREATPDDYRDAASAVRLISCAIAVGAPAATGVGVPAAIAILALGCSGVLLDLLEVDVPQDVGVAFCVVGSVTTVDPLGCVAVILDDYADFLEEADRIEEGTSGGGDDEDCSPTLTIENACPGVIELYLNGSFEGTIPGRSEKTFDLSPGEVTFQSYLPEERAWTSLHEEFVDCDSHFFDDPFGILRVCD